MMVFVSGMSLFGGTFLLPLFLGQIRGYSSAQVGTTMLVSGLTMFLCAPTIGGFVRRSDARLCLAVGFALIAWSLGLGARITDQWGFGEFMTLQIVRGIGSMVALIASQQMTVSTLPVSQMKDASGLLNLVRNVAGAIGLAALTTILTHQTAYHLADLASAVSTANPASQEMLDGLSQMMGQSGLADPDGAARKAMWFLMRRQAATLSFGDAFLFLSLACWAAVGLAFFASKSANLAAQPQGAH